MAMNRSFEFERSPRTAQASRIESPDPTPLDGVSTPAHRNGRTTPEFFEHERPHRPSSWGRGKGIFSGQGPKNYVRADERIREDACERLAYHPYIDASDIEVFVNDGEITLRGTVDSRMVKRAAEECVEHVRGVKDVHNQLRLRPIEDATD